MFSVTWPSGPVTAATGSTAPAAPPTSNATLRPPIGFPNGSFTVTVTCEVLPSPVTGVPAVTVDWLPSGEPGFTVTLAFAGVTVTAPAVIWAVIVFTSAVGEVKIVVALPRLAPVPVVSELVNVLLLPLTLNCTVAPLMSTLFASRAVTVIVVPLADPAVNDASDEVTEDLVWSIGPGVTPPLVPVASN